ncbi:conjugal transfer protein TraX [Pseudomonas sp. J452]|uniref:conjugal transfer protein TraX n=1 Tax=Pseudomonas sp. J452 TaxID=2898441 RepID=UPI0021ADC849|nr:conjugal transfer protein TraX [Pseudomonas sp. J452]UUY09013.1 conjugal transfer protein TraX [Pseudomonas sp. J452]
MNNFERNNSLDFIKWIALLSMIIDHAWYVIPSELQEPFRWMRTIGRLAFPLFCLAISANVYRQPVGYSGGLNYLGGIFFFALISQQPYSRFFEGDHLNILFTLGLGLVITQAIHHRKPTLIAAGITALVIAVVYRPILSFGLCGALLPAVLLLAIQARSEAAVSATWPLAALLAVLANTGSGLLLWTDLPVTAQTGIATAALAPILGLALLQIRLRLVWPVGTWMYPIYPGHLLLLGLLPLAWV